MKRALAERAKQSLESLPQEDLPTNANDASNGNNGNGSSNSNGNANDNSNGSQHGNSNGLHQHQNHHATNSSLKLKRPNTNTNTNSTASFSSLEQPSGQPPLKIPRTERLAPSSSSASLSLSPRPGSSKSIKKTSSALFANTNSDQSSANANANANATTASTKASTATASDAATEHSSHAHPTSSKRQLSAFGAAATTAAATTAATAAPTEEDEEETEKDRNSAFYLKHQNRALATELKGLQHCVQWLERERDYRRQQCLLSVQALNSLQATWTQLEDVLSHSHHHHTGLQQHHQLQQQLQQQRQIQQSSDGDPHQQEGNSDGPASTGTGGSVEWTLSLSKALAALGTSNTASFTMDDSMAMDIQGRDENDDGDDEDGEDENNRNNSHRVDQGEGVDHTEKATLEDLSAISANVSARAAVLQEWILETVLKQLEQQQKEQQTPDAAVPPASDSVLADQKKIADISAKCELLQHQVTELKAARDATASRERRVRRNLYRLSAGMMTVQQVLQTLEDAEGDDVNGRHGDQEEMIIKQQAAEQAATVAKLQEQLEDSKNAAHVKKEGNEATPATTVSSAEVKSLKENVASLEQICHNRETSVQELNAKLKERELRINQLSAKQRSEEETKQLESFEQTRQQLAAAEERVSELQSKLQETTEKWSQALGNEKVAVETIDELQSKHTKRWAEFTNAMEQGDIVQEEHTGEATPLDEKEAQAKQITQLQHKLNQAFENVRQAESTRENLKEALTMNESLQAKVDEFKAKYLAVQAGRSSANSRPSTSEPGSATPREKDPSQTPREKDPSQTPRERDPSHTPREKDPSQVTNAPSSSADKQSSGPPDSREKAEKMHREHRRMRKELAAVTASKEAAKAKLDRAEKERDGLMDANARLLKQISEKDEMNAKSLSTILHLKSMTDQVSTERDNLEQQSKSASQLALAARLATNAKERVSEELVKEKAALSNRLEELEKDHKAKERELVRIKSEWSNASGKIAALNSEITNTVKRSDELVAESEKKQEEIRKLVDSVAKTERQASETKAKLDEAVKQSSGSSTVGAEESAAASSFTVDQLSTQVSVLKSRLACPVCHYRDKECIIMRCRHMHCRECVEGQMSSRSRKCPTCNNKFSEKDVEDIWLS